MGLEGDDMIVEDADSGAGGKSFAVSCTICLEIVADNGDRSGDRSWAKLQCGHQFHLDCIGSAINIKGAMQCPNCRKIEKGQWLYANGFRSFPEFSSDDWTHDEDLYDLSYSEMSEMRPLTYPEGGIEPMDDDAAFTQVMGPDSHFWVRTYGLGVTPSRLLGESSSGLGSDSRVLAAEQRVAAVEEQILQLRAELERDSEERRAELERDREAHQAELERDREAHQAHQRHMDAMNARMNEMTQQIQDFHKIFESLQRGVGTFTYTRTDDCGDNDATPPPDNTQS